MALCGQRYAPQVRLMPSSRTVLALFWLRSCSVLAPFPLCSYSILALFLLRSCSVLALFLQCSYSACTVVMEHISLCIYICKGLFCPYTLSHFLATSTTLFVWLLHLFVCLRELPWVALIMLHWWAKISKSGCFGSIVVPYRAPCRAREFQQQQKHNCFRQTFCS